MGEREEKYSELKQERLERNLRMKAHIFSIYEDKLRMPDGHIAYYDVLTHKGAAAVIPVMEDGRIIMVRQYRNAVGRTTLEIPAGGRNTIEEDYMLAAKRELEEETGYRSDNIYHLVTLNTAVAFSDETVEVFVAKDLVPTVQNLDADEFIELEIYSLDELKTLISSGAIKDAKTISSIMSYAVLAEDI